MNGLAKGMVLCSKLSDCGGGGSENVLFTKKSVFSGISDSFVDKRVLKKFNFC